jgi:hypothetical protein
MILIGNRMYTGQKVATAIMPNIALKLGENNLVLTTYVKPDPGNAAAVAATRKMLSDFTGGIDSQVTVGNGKSSNMPSVDAAFGALSMQQTLPSNKQKLINVSLSHTAYNPS